jgi:hypothetical protein
MHDSVSVNESKTLSNMIVCVFAVDLFRHVSPQQLPDLGDYLDHVLADIATECSTCPHGKFKYITIHLEYQDSRIGPLTTSLNLKNTSGIVQSIRFDVNSTKLCLTSNVTSMFDIFSIRALAISILFVLKRAFFEANGNTKSYSKLEA